MFHHWQSNCVVCKMKSVNSIGLCILLLLILPLADGAMSSGITHGFIGYNELNIATPRVRFWNGTTFNFTTEQSAQSVGVDGSADLSWLVSLGNHERDEFVLATLDQSNDVNIQVMNATRQWGNLLEVSSDVSNSAYRAFFYCG